MALTEQPVPPRTATDAPGKIREEVGISFYTVPMAPRLSDPTIWYRPTESGWAGSPAVAANLVRETPRITQDSKAENERMREPASKPLIVHGFRYS